MGVYPGIEEKTWPCSAPSWTEQYKEIHTQATLGTRGENTGLAMALGSWALSW